MTAIRELRARPARWAVLIAAAVAVGCAPPPAERGATPATPATLPLLAPEPGKAGMDKWAGIEVGSRGVKPIVMGFAKTAGGWDFTADTTFESKNTELGTLNDDNTALDPKRVEATVAAVKELDEAIRARHGLSAERVKVVFSSGVFTRFKDKAKADEARKQLTAAVEKAVGRAPDFITEQQEAELAVRGIVSPAGRAGRMLVDIGSGNMRFGWYNADAFESFTVDAGTKLVRDAGLKAAAAQKQEFAAVIPTIRKTLLDAPLAEKVKAAKGFDKPSEVLLIGGAAWALTTFTHPGTTDQLTVPLTAADVEAFAALAKMKTELARGEVVNRVKAGDAAGKEFDRVVKVFTPEDLQAAAEILRAIFAEGKLAERKVLFFQKGQHAWIAGYLMAAAKLPD